jgi:hypothetical protein
VGLSVREGSADGEGAGSATSTGTAADHNDNGGAASNRHGIAADAAQRHRDTRTAGNSDNHHGSCHGHDASDDDDYDILRACEEIVLRLGNNGMSSRA